MPSQAGDKLPDATVYEGKPDNKVKVRDVFKGKKGVLFGVPGKPEPLVTLLYDSSAILCAWLCSSDQRASRKVCSRISSCFRQT